MNCSFFGSYSKQTFMDLYALNVRSQHTILTVYEIMEKEIISTTHVALDDVNRCPDLVRGLVRAKSSSYLMGFLLDDEDRIDEHRSGTLLRVSMIDTFNDKSLSYCMEKNKEFMQICIASDTIGVQVGRKQKVYVDDFQSISETPMSGFDEINTPNIHYLNISNITKD